MRAFSFFARGLVVMTWTVASTAGFQVPPPIGPYSTVYTSPFHRRIHTFGNVGLGGRVHAALAPAATRVIDHVAYKGRNMRAELSGRIATHAPLDAAVLDVGCGVGTLTRELARAGFANVTALDTSQEMLDAAGCGRIANDVRWVRGNGADAARIAGRAHAVAVACMVMHEMPESAHTAFVHGLLEATADAADGRVVICDIHPHYSPSWSMQAGEPYIFEYKQSIERSLRRVAREEELALSRDDLVEGHVRVWTLSRDAA